MSMRLPNPVTENELIAEYEETIAILQSEIARLEDELRMRDEARIAASESSATIAIPTEDKTKQISELLNDLNERDQVISFLSEQLSLVEEAEAASKAEWEQLHRWVEEVEQRVDNRDEEGRNLKRELEAEIRRAEAERRAADTERRAWEQQRKSLEEELDRLRNKLAEVAKHSSHQSVDLVILEALEQENLRLRQTCEELTLAAAAAVEVESARAELEILRSRLDETEHELHRVRDDLLRERKEHEAELAKSRTETLQATIASNGGGIPPTIGGKNSVELYATLPAEERMWAFRKHLQEVHQREIEQRSQKSLSSRLSRLWKKTGPPPV